MDNKKKRNFNSDLNSCLQSLDSNKVTERKIKRQEIQQLLENDEVIEVLNYNSSLQQIHQSQSLDDNLVTWKCLLNCYHRSLILEVENEDKKKQRSGFSYKQPNLENCSILLRNIINKANKDKPYLPINDLLKCILDVSQNNTFQLYMGEVYYKILEQSILSRSYYWHSLSSYWNDLFSLTYNLYNEDFANMKHVSIKIMKHIVVRGDAHSNVSLAVKKKIFSYLKQSILDTLQENNDFSLREDLIILVFDVCRTLWIECRKSLCQFIEENCTHLVNFYENDKPKKIQETLYNLLTLFIKIHHPKCIDFNHKDSYAYNENKWIVQLHHIYEFVRREILQIKNNSNPNFLNYISELAVTIFNIVYFNNLDSSILLLDECPTPKRKKYDINVLSFVNDLTNLKTSEICTRLNIITKILENHSLPFHEKDYIHLLESLTICLNSYKDTNSIKYLIICCNELIKSENICELNQFGPFLKTVWTYALKMIMSNENADLSHSLLHSLIVLINWHDEMYYDVLRLYFNKTIKIDDSSLKTLVVLFKTRGFCSNSLNKTNMILLLDWLLPLKLQDSLLVESFSKLNPYLLSEVVDLILTKPSVKNSFINHNNLETISCHNFRNTHDFALQDCPNVQLQIADLTQNKSIRRSIDENIFERLINFIERIIEVKEKPSIATLQMYLSMANFLCFLENWFPQFGNDFNEFKSYKLKYMEKVNNIVTELNTDVNHHNNEAFVNVCTLFHKQLQFVDDIIINELMNHKTNKVIMTKLYNLSKYNDFNSIDQVLDYDNLKKEQKLSIQAMKALLRTCFYKGQTDYQTYLLETLVEDLKELEGSISQSYTYFKIINFLHIALGLDNLTTDMIIQLNKFIKQIAKTWCSHQEGFIKITQLLNDALQITTKNNSDKVCTTNLLMLIWSLQKISVTKNCGPKMVCAFVDLLGNFASTKNGSFGSTWNIDIKVVQPMSPKIILYYLNSPFLQVRISAIRCIKVMCDSYENNPNTYILNYEEMFDIILHKIHDGFTIDCDISEEEREDEYTNRIYTYLLCMQTLITSSVKYQKECLFEVLQTINTKQINLDLVINMLESIKIELKIKSFMELLENNLKFLLWKWHIQYSTFEEFPIKLFSCTTMEQFFKKYPFEIIPILVIKNDLNFLNSMNILHKVIEETFPVIFSYLLAIKIVDVPFINHDEIKKVIVDELSEKRFNELIKFQCSDIILQFIQMVVINTEHPIVPIQISSDQFLILINIFQEIYVKNNIPFLTHMSAKKPNYIQTIVHILYVNIFKTSTSKLWYQSFFQYTVFMKALIGQLLDYNQIDDFSHFLINQSIQSTITLLNQNNIERHSYVIEYLEWLLINPKSVLKLNLSQIGPLTSTLRTLAKMQPSLNEKSLNLLNILKNLSDQNIFCETKKENETALYKDINYFLYQQNENIDIIQSLQCLKLKLQTNEIELHNMYQELLKMRGFSEDCTKSILHCLICTLIKLTKNFEFEVQMLAASCLGILGPTDLTTLILQPEPEVLKLESHISPEYSFMKHIIELVLNYLSDDNISVLEASNITLFKVLATQNGQSLYEELGPKVLYPFKSSQIEELDVELSFDIEQFNLLIDENEIWCPIDSSISYSSWITNITKHLLETLQGFCKSLLPIAENKPLFCEKILPHLVYFLLEYIPPTRPILNKHLNWFFLKHYKTKMEMVSTEKIKTNFHQVNNSIENNIYCNKLAVQCLLRIINFTRLQQNNPLQSILDINYLYVSQAAQFCSAHFTSIQYLELWCETQFKRMNKDKESMVFNPVDMISEMLPKEGLLLQTILHESYKSIGDCDAIEGCGSSYLLNLSSRTQYYQQLRKWDRVMENCDLQQTTELISKDYLEAFSNAGLQNVAHIMAFNDSLKYDYSWQLNKWDLPDSGDKSFESLHYHALRCVHLNNLERVIPIINEARLVVIQSLYCASLESTATIYSPLAKLKIIEDLDDFISTSNKKKLFNNWLNQKTINTNDFININKILSQRCKLLDFDGDKRSGILRIKIAELAQQNDWLQVAGKHLTTVATLNYYQKHTILWAKVEETRLLWKRNDCHMARVLLKCVVEELENYDYPFLHSLALQLYGSWMEETKSETSNDIIRKYFQKSINKIKLELKIQEEFGLDCKKVLSDAYKHLSLFTDTLYQQLYKYIKTEDFQKRMLGVEQSSIEGETMVQLGKSTKNQEKLKAGIYLINQSKIDISDISNKNNEKNKYLKLTLQNYLQLMTLDDESKLPIYRIVSLWLENKENNEINDIVDKEFIRNPSYKFILVLPQLVAHLSSENKYSFHKSLETIINRCAMDHPYQTIPIVYAVANTNIDQKFIQCEPHFNDEEQSRVLAAKHLMSKWKRNTNISSIVRNTEKLYEAFIQLSYTKFSCPQGQRSSIPATQPLMKITNSELYMYPAATLPLSKHGDYSNVISIVKFENSFLNAGGIHEPKKIDCLCSDGILRSLLLKGNEDMHQDAIMQQVFVLMNRLLNSNKSTAKRKLAIRTYKVIPFSKQSGIAEWCVNTMSVMNYLIGTKMTMGAHQKYRPEDMPPAKAKDILRLSQAQRDSELTKQRKYLDICKVLKPVFRYYFFEKFLSPSIWFERRQAFIHSVATTSMIGYILGLGDRHFNNILIDNNTAELIHIDFGVAFEQGTLLNTPETVPFRLTRDIVDGMGICGIEGTFRKCCEKTMSVLRQNQDVIVTITEVLLYDPCYQWALTGKKAAQLQNESTRENSHINDVNEVNKLAERSLNRVRVKLCGMEQAETAAASINGQVNLLIQKARDPNNLALIFHGWQAYL
ncbi:serine-protein kinase ATM isoform X1 [Rhopalosiphum maidis]|uniref:serine-protein kinase ATM isoform X1 n=1 Tax=Rhopalosiphum maidis TaxID=43146 RepID=UPI000F0017BD|nr:serine-protein kinase ATM isoform X1 [Rhopalosiphum maidis]